MATHMQHSATPRVHGIVRCSRRSRQYFRRYLPLLALSRERWGGVSYAGRARHGPRHTSCGGNGGTTSARMPTPRGTAASLLQQEACEQAAPVLLLLSCSPRQGGVGKEVTGRTVSIRIPGSEERVEEAPLELEELKLGRSAGPRFAEPEETSASAGPPGRPSVPSTMRRSRTMNRMASMERLRNWARRAAWRFALRKALRRWRELGAAADPAGAAAVGGGAAAAS